MSGQADFAGADDDDELLLDEELFDESLELELLELPDLLELPELSESDELPVDFAGVLALAAARESVR